MPSNTTKLYHYTSEMSDISNLPVENSFVTTFYVYATEKVHICKDLYILQGLKLVDVGMNTLGQTSLTTWSAETAWSQ